MNLNNITDAASKIYQQVFRVPHQPTEAEELCDAIQKARSDIERAESLFNETTDNAICDYASYNILAAKARYSYLLQEAKNKNLHI